MLVNGNYPTASEASREVENLNKGKNQHTHVFNTKITPQSHNKGKEIYHINGLQIRVCNKLYFKT